MKDEKDDFFSDRPLGEPRVVHESGFIRDWQWAPMQADWVRQAKLEGVAVAANNLLKVLEVAIPALDEVCVYAQYHGLRYGGPDVSREVEVLRRELDKVRP